MSTEHIVVVGNGIAGFELCRRLTMPDAPHKVRVSVFGEERAPAYDRVNLTRLLRGGSLADITLGDRAWYERRHIALHTDDPVVDINRSERVVFTASGGMTDYDHLVLATGSAPRVPRIPGVDHPDVFVYRTVADAEALRGRARTAKRAVVLGGGLLGLEAAGALRGLGLDVSVIEAGPHLMPRQLVEPAAAVLRRAVETVGLRVYVDTAAEAIRAETDALAISLAGGGVLTADIVVLAAGITPRDELARRSGLAVAERGGVVVDNRLATSDPRILAIGECASHAGTVYGLARPAHQMAAIAASRLLGGVDTFRGGDTSCTLDLLGVDVVVLGAVDGDAAITYSRSDRWRALYLDGDRVVGARAVGAWDDLDRVRAAIRDGDSLSRKEQSRFERTGDPWRETLPVAIWPDNTIVCACERVSRGALTAAMRAGCRTPEALTRSTRAGGVCGACTPLLAAMCGASAPRMPRIRGRVLLLVASALAAAWIAVAASPPRELVARLPFGSPWATGLAMLAPLALALVLPARKRLRRFRAGNFGWYRAGHALIGVTAAVFAAVHTRLSLGNNLNRALAITFAIVVASGAVLGSIAALESRGVGGIANAARRWRPRLAWGHWLALWLFPVLLAFHVAAALYF